MTDSGKNYSLSTWRGEFVDGSVEQAFRSHIRAGMTRDLHMVLWIWAGLLVIFAITDYISYGPTRTTHLLVISRMVTVAALMLFIYSSRRNPVLVTDGYAATAVKILGFSAFFLIFFLRPGSGTFNLGIMMVMLIAFFVCVPNRLLLATAAALYAIAGTMGVMWLMGVLGWEQAGLLLLLVFPAFLGYFAAQRLHLTLRRQYIALCEAEAGTRRLQAEVERRKLLEQELQHQAITDPLTGLFNRRHFESQFNRELERARRQSTGLCLCMIDLDHFKQINDEHGHQTGDLVLQLVADFLRGSLRQTDVVGRIGGEEFIVLMPDTTLDDATAIVERVRTSLAQQVIRVEDKTVSVTGTFALTAVDAEKDNLSSALRKVDHALYEGKDQGRDRLVLSPAEPAQKR